MIGCGSMGGGMALLFAEHGITVLLNDPGESTVDSLLKTAEKDGIRNMLEKHLDYEDLCKNLDSPKVFVFSLPHGTVGDSVVEGLHPYLEKGDLIIDASNENWQNTQRRQGKLVTQGVHYVADAEWEAQGHSIYPLSVFSSVDRFRSHYVKMIHNGIEHGMMSVQAEAWQIMNLGLDMTYDEIGDVFAKWNTDGELRGTFLIDIGAQINKQRDDKGKHVLSVVEDKVVQDIDGTEGTGVWSSREAIRLHVPAPTLSDAHYVRVASAFRKDRKKIKATFGGHFPLGNWTGSEEEKPAFLEDLRKAVYTGFLAAFVQGINVIDLADQENKWSIKFSEVVQIWRNGCIIKADYIGDLLEEIFKDPEDTDRDLLHNERIAKELSTNFPALKQVVAMGVQTNAIIPSLSASLEYLKYSVNTILPTQFYEAQLDFFGKHMFDLKSEPAGEPETGHHHYEWKPA
ncbi:MAG: hypothetical protein Q9161_007716 [Pseudevernia consocians]